MTVQSKSLQQTRIEKAVSSLLETVTSLNAAADAKVDNSISSYGSLMWHARTQADLHAGLIYCINRDGLQDAYVNHLMSQGERLCKYVTDSSLMMPVLGYGIEDFITKTGNYHE